MTDEESGQNVIDFVKGRDSVEAGNFVSLLERFLSDSRENNDLEARLKNFFKIIFFTSDETVNGENVKKFFVHTTNENEITIDRLKRELSAEFKLIKKTDNYCDKALSAVRKVKNRFVDVFPISDDPGHILQISRYITSIFDPLVSYLEGEIERKKSGGGQIVDFQNK